MKILFIQFLICISIITISQGQEPKIKFGRISTVDLSMHQYPLDTSAEAVILSKTGTVSYNADLDYPVAETNHIVLKLLKEEAVPKYQNIQINYYSRDRNSIVEDLHAIIHIPGGKQIEIQANQIVEEQVQEGWSSKKIVLTGIMPGSIIEYQYKKLSRDLIQPVDWFFQSEIPIRYAELTTQFPKPFQFAIQYQGGPDPEPICKDNTFKGIQFAEHLFILKNVPALKEECCITTMNDYYSRVRYISTSPQSTWKLLLKDLFQKPEWVGKVTESQRQLVLEEAFIDTNANLKQQEIAYKLYNYLNDKFIWNGKYGIGTEQSIDETLKSKTANSGDLNKLMLAGLQQVGIDVKPVLISTRDNGKINEHLPLLQQFNHMVLLARIDGRETWIDMGDPYLPIGTLRPNSLNGRGLIVSVENPDFVNISSAESTTLFLIKGDIDSTGKFSGTIESRYAGYHARNYRISSQADRKNYAKTILLSQGKTIPISDMEYINPIITVLPYHTRGKIKAWPIADITEGKMRINLLHPHFFQSLPVNVEKRTYPVEINYPEEIAFMMELTIPDSYAIETLPDFYNSNRNGLVISADATSIGNQVLLKFVVDMNKIFFQPEEFPLLQKSLNELHQMLDEKIILTKLK